jgi:hypothetical protein
MYPHTYQLVVLVSVCLPMRLPTMKQISPVQNSVGFHVPYPQLLTNMFIYQCFMIPAKTKRLAA